MAMALMQSGAEAASTCSRSPTRHGRLRWQPGLTLSTQVVAPSPVQGTPSPVANALMLGWPFPTWVVSRVSPCGRLRSLVLRRCSLHGWYPWSGAESFLRGRHLPLAGYGHFSGAESPYRGGIPQFCIPEEILSFLSCPRNFFLKAY